MKFFNQYYIKLCKETVKPLFSCYKNIHMYSYNTPCFNKNIKIGLPAVCYAKIHVSSALSVKSHQEKENEYAHIVLEKLSEYSNSVIKPPVVADLLKFSSESPKELLDFAQVTKVHKNLEDKSISFTVSGIVQIIPKLSDTDLILCLHLLCCWPPTRKTWTPHFKAIWNKLDYECVTRIPNWNVQQKLLIADYWFQLRLSRITLYNKNMIVDILQNLEQQHLTNSEMVQLMFYINLQREIPANFLKILETRLISVIKTISMDELSIICLGFFKTKNKITNISIISSLIERFMKEVENSKQVTIVALLKFLKKSMQLSYTELYIPLLHKCVRFVNNWTVRPCVHLALLASECHVYHPLLLDAVIEKVTLEIEDARLKDCTKLLQCLAHFNHAPTVKFNESLLMEFKNTSRKVELLDHPRDNIYSALYWAYMGFYDYDLLNRVLNPNFIEDCVKLFPETDITFAEVDCCVEIECRDYDGHRLDKSYWTILDRRKSVISSDTTKPNTYTRLSNEIIESLKFVLNNGEKFAKKQILPHVILPDIVIQLFGSSKSILTSEQYLLVPPANEIWACIVLGIPFSFAYRSKYITGVTSMKLRQLEKLGYRTIFIPYFELPRDHLLRQKYLKLRLEALKDCNKIKFIH